MKVPSKRREKNGAKCSETEARGPAGKRPQTLLFQETASKRGSPPPGQRDLALRIDKVRAENLSCTNHHPGAPTTTDVEGTSSRPTA